MRVARSAFLSAILVASVIPVADAQDASTARADFHKRVDAIFAPWAGTQTPGCAVGVSRDGVPEYVRGYGMSNLEHGIAIAPDSVFHVASVSKQFTAFSILLLAQEGKLSLDDDVHKYLPELADYGKPLTLSHLMHHTNGLREQGQLLFMSGWRSDDVFAQDDMLKVLAKQRGLNFVPGSEVSYNNSGYVLLAEIVKRVSGKALPEFARERIFEPLGMRDTQFQEDHNKIVPRRAAAYRSDEKGPWRTSIPSADYYGSSTLLTTVGDLLKWQQNLVDGRIGGKDVQRQMLTSGRLNDGTEIGYGGGLRVRSYRGLKTIGHDGLEGGYRADTILFPEQRLGIVALCNGTTIVPDELTRKVAEIYLGDQLGPDIKPEVTLPPGRREALAGTYWNPVTDEIARLEFKDGTLRAAGVRGALIPTGEETFRVGETVQEWSFRNTGTATELSIVDFWPTARIFRRVDEPKPAAAALEALVGQYRSDETGTTYTVALKDGKLLLQWLKQPGMALEAVGGARFATAQSWTVTFTRSAGNAVDGLTVTSRRLRRLQLQRIEPEQAVATASRQAAAR
jgi:CubicO group peptidase (beta-lactamase class C family)